VYLIDAGIELGNGDEKVEKRGNRKVKAKLGMQLEWQLN